MKRIISLLLSLSLMMSLLPGAALAGETLSDARVSCDGDHSGMKMLTGDKYGELYVDGEHVGGEVLPDGNYYLGEDITVTYEHYVEGETNICLNGHMLTLDSEAWGDATVFFVIGTLRIYDCGDTLRSYSIDENGLWVPNESGEVFTFGGVIAGGTGDRYVYSPGGMSSSNSRQGGAVFCLGRFELHGGNIVGNSADHGAGVYVGGGSFLMTNGRIAGNVATGTDGQGGGVYVDSASFTMTGGSIDCNRAVQGSGVYQDGTGTVDISGCVIDSNVAGDKGAVYLNGTANLSGEVHISDNQSKTGVAPNLYLASGTCVDVSGGLDEYAEIRVYAEDVDEPFTTGGSVKYLDNFKSDRDGYRVVALEETELALMKKFLCLIHTPGKAVNENKVPATCTVEGSYDAVVYCVDCGEELSRESMVLPKGGHKWGAPSASFKHTCGVCGTTEEVDSISGETDDELEWVLTKDGVLTVFGEGECTELEEMEEYDVKTVILEEGITALGSKAIKMLANITSLSLPATMEDLDADAINRYMERISSITVAAGNPEYTVWDRMLFNRRMTELLCAPRCGIDETVTVPEGVKAINGYAFANSWVSDLALPITLESVNAYAFDGCTELATVGYPGTKETWTALVTVKSGNTALKDADFTYGTVDSLSGTCGDDTVWTLTADGVLTISGTGRVTDRAWPAGAVREAVLEEGITAIGEGVFTKHTELNTITIPKTVTAVEEGAFRSTHVETVIYNGSEPQWGLVVMGDDNDSLLEAEILFDSWLEVEWNKAHTVLSISGMVKDSAWVTAAFYEADGRMAFVKHYAAADVKSGVGISSSQADLTACTAKVMVLDANYAPMGMPYLPDGDIEEPSADWREKLVLLLSADDSYSNGTIQEYEAIEYLDIHGKTHIARYDVNNGLDFDDILDLDGTAGRLFILRESTKDRVYLEEPDDDDVCDQLEADDSQVNGYEEGNYELDTAGTAIKCDDYRVDEDAVFFVGSYNSKDEAVYDVMTLSELEEDTFEAYGQILTFENEKGTRCSVVGGYFFVDTPDAGGSGENTVTAWLYATEKAYIDGGKKAERGTLLFSDGKNTYEMETGKGCPGTWDLGQSFDLTVDDDGEVTKAVLSGDSAADQCFLLHVNVNEEKTGISFEFGELEGAFADGEVSCLVLEPGCSGVPGIMDDKTMADMAETGVSHLYRGVDKDDDGKIDYLLVKPTLYGMVTKAGKDYVLLEDNEGNRMTEAVSGEEKWYLEDTLDMEDLPETDTILKLTWNIDTGLYEVEELEERQGTLEEFDRRRFAFDFGICYFAEDGWVDTDALDEGEPYTVILDEKLLVRAELMEIEYADAADLYADGADIAAKAKDAVELVTLLDLMAGYMEADGSMSFRPENTVTRAQMAKLVYVILNEGEDDNAENWQGKVHYTDLTDHWCEGYANYCGTLKLEPTGGAFRPDDAITCAEACRMLLCAAEYDLSNYLDEGWESPVLRDAAAAGLLDGYLYNVNTAVPRQWMAKLLENFLTQMTVTDGKKEVTPGEKYLDLTEDSLLWKQVYGD